MTVYEMRISGWSSDVCSSDLMGDSRLWRRPVGLAGQRHEAAHRLHDIVVTRAVRIRAALPEAGDRTDDQPREIGAQPRGIEPIFDEPADLVIPDHDIGTGEQRARLGLPFGRRDVDLDAPLPAVAAMILR